MRTTLGLRGDQRIFLYQGRLTSGRGIELLMDYFQARQGDRDIVVFMGNGPGTQAIRRRADACPRIRLLPAVPPRELPRLELEGLQPPLPWRPPGITKVWPIASLLGSVRPLACISRFRLTPLRSAISERVSPGLTTTFAMAARGHRTGRATGSGNTTARAKAANERRMGTINGADNAMAER
jgi:hypothetical protein